MAVKKDSTKELLASCFKELMQKMPFDKITIKMITNKAGLIRPTFYKHFQDKYELVEWIFKTEVGSNVTLLIQNHMEFDAAVMLFRGMGKDKKFYRRAYEMEPGPNSFENILKNFVHDTLMKLAERYSAHGVKKLPHLTPELAVDYYTYGLINLLKDWINSDSPMSAEEIANAYIYLLSHPVQDFLSFTS